MEDIIAFGAENKTSFSVLSAKGMYTSERIDDLKNLSNFNKYEFAIKEYLSSNKICPVCMVCDMHPDYHSSAFAEKLHSENKGSILLKVQHHHAHIVSCMEDNVLEGEVIGVSFDGTGYGDDGRSWGGEFLLCSKSEFCRMFHLKYIPQPGADKAASEGWRMALAYLYGAFGPGFYMVDSPVLKRLEKKRILTVGKMINKNINSPLTSSMGRLFDAVSSLIGVCDVSVFSGEAAMLLEEAAVSGINEVYNYEVSGEDICVFQMIREIISDMNKGISPGIISAKFHNTVAEIIFDISNRIYQLSGVNKVVVSGGCFLNKYIVNTIRDRFDKSSLDLFTHKKFSPGDSGLSVGQIVVADSM